jgi:hypothetical protein
MNTKMNFKGMLLAAMMMMGATAFAQDITGTGNPDLDENYTQGFRLGFGVNGSLATGDYFDWGLGGDVRLQYDLSRKTSLTLTTGFTNLFAKDDIKDLGYIPAKLGFKAFVWEDRLYVLGEAGAAFAVTNDYDETSFLWAPGIGYAADPIDISIRYEGTNDFHTDQIALRIAYGFKL